VILFNPVQTAFQTGLTGLTGLDVGVQESGQQPPSSILTDLTLNHHSLISI